MDSMKKVEWADYGMNRLPTIYERLQADYKRQHNELVKEDLRLSIEIAHEFDPIVRAEKIAKLQAVAAKCQQLNEGMRLDSIGRSLGKTFEKVQDAPTCIEKRFITMPTTTSAPMKTNKPGQAKLRLNGLAAVYNQTAIIGGAFKETILLGAFSEIVKTADCKFLLNHNADYLFGRTAPNQTGTLRLYDTPAGLAFWDDLIDDDSTSIALATRIERRDLTQCSFAFSVGEDSFKLPEKYGDLTERFISRIDRLYDVSGVVYPAYESTCIQVVHGNRSSDKYQFLDEEQIEDMQIADELNRLRRQRRERDKRIELGYARAGLLAERNKPKVQDVTTSAGQTPHAPQKNLDRRGAGPLAKARISLRKVEQLIYEEAKS